MEEMEMQKPVVCYDPRKHSFLFAIDLHTSALSLCLRPCQVTTYRNALVRVEDNEIIGYTVDTQDMDFSKNGHTVWIRAETVLKLAPVCNAAFKQCRLFYDKHHEEFLHNVHNERRQLGDKYALIDSSSNQNLALRNRVAIWQMLQQKNFQGVAIYFSDRCNSTVSEWYLLLQTKDFDPVPQEFIVDIKTLYLRQGQLSGCHVSTIAAFNFVFDRFLTRDWHIMSFYDILPHVMTDKRGFLLELFPFFKPLVQLMCDYLVPACVLRRSKLVDLVDNRITATAL